MTHISTLAAAIAALTQPAIDERIFPGCVVYAWRDGAAAHHAAYGSTMYEDPGSRPVVPDTIYDVASLTKPVTATAALILHDGGQIGLDDPARRFLPGLRAAGVTVRHLLTHSSGLEIRLSALRERGPEGIRAAVYGLEPVRAPGSYTVYANISTLLLGDIVAAVFGAPLDVAIGELLLGPLGMAETGFRPDERLRPRIAPTEWDDEWRGELVHGAAHDESAHALGGVAGHAGLFSSAADIGRLARLWLQGGAWRGRQILREATVALASHDHTSHMDTSNGLPLPSGLGWALARPGFMGPAPAGSLGHTGFTGPAIVIMPAAQAALVILSNRTYPRRTPPPYRHHAITAAIVAAILAERS